MKKLAIGFDFGATWMKAGLVDQNGFVIHQIKKKTNAYFGKITIIKKIESIIIQLIQKAGDNKVFGIGLGAPGPIDFNKGIIINPPNLPGWHNVYLRKILKDKFKLPAIIDNDTNLILLGEQFKGVARDKKNVILITVGTGIGGAILVKGEIYRGSKGRAGEFGHIIINSNNREKCGCGSYSCLETFASVTAMVELVKKSIKKGKISQINKLVNNNLDKIDGLTIYRAAQKGDKLAQDSLKIIAKNLGYGVCSLINIFDPDMIIVGGQITKTGKYFWQSLRQSIKKNCCLIKNIQIVKIKLGDKSGILGGAFLVFNSIK